MFLTAIGSYFYQLDKKSYWIDEGVTVEVSRTGTLTDLLEWRKSDYNPPLFDIMIRPFTVDKAFDEYWPRAVAAVGGCLFLLMMFALGKAMAGPAGALWALGLSAASFQVLYFAQEARPYSWVLAAAAWAALSAYKLFGSPDPITRGQGFSYTVQFAAAAASLMLLHYQGAVFIAFCGAVSLYWAVIHKRLKYFFIWSLLVLVATAFWIPSYVLHSTDPPEHLRGPSASLWDNLLILFQFAFNDFKALAILALSSLAVFVLFMRKEIGPETALCLWLIMGPMLFVHFYHAARGLQPVTPRHLIVVLPFIYLLFAIMLSRIRRGAVSAALVLGLVATSFYDTVQNKRYYDQTFKQEDARGIAQQIGDLDLQYGDRIQFALRAWTNSAVNLYLELFESNVKLETFLFCGRTPSSPLNLTSQFVAVIETRNCRDSLNLAEILPAFKSIQTIELQDRSLLTVLTQDP